MNRPGSGPPSQASRPAQPTSSLAHAHAPCHAYAILTDSTGMFVRSGKERARHGAALIVHSSSCTSAAPRCTSISHSHCPKAFPIPVTAPSAALVLVGLISSPAPLLPCLPALLTIISRAATASASILCFVFLQARLLMEFDTTYMSESRHIDTWI